MRHQVHVVALVVWGAAIVAVPGGQEASSTASLLEENEKIKRQIVWAHVLRTVYFIVAYEDDTYNIRPFRLLTDRFHIQALQCLCSLAP